MEGQIGTGMGIVAGLLILAVFGGIVGWVASLLIKGTGLGLVKDILLGILRSVVGAGCFRHWACRSAGASSALSCRRWSVPCWCC